jgi:hypothetical protein
LTPSARSGNLIAGDGTRNGLSAPNKEPATNKKPLDRKTPIQVSNEPCGCRGSRLHQGVAPGHLIFSEEGSSIWPNDVRTFFAKYLGSGTSPAAR